MISKLQLQSIIDKYYLGLNESVKWVIKDNNLSIDFMTPTKDVIGKVTCNNFDMEDGSISIYDTKKLQSLVSICNGDLLLELEKNNAIYTKLKISDLNFNLTYALSDPLLIGKVGTVNTQDWVVELNLEADDVTNLIKAKSALSQVDNMLITTTKNLDDVNVVEFVFGDEAGHNNKITYQVKGRVDELNLQTPYNSDVFKTILQANKGMEEGKLFLSSMGLLKFEFKSEGNYSEYFMVRRSDTDF